MDRGRSASRISHGRFPRRRGDGPLDFHLHMSDKEFPPQARGWTLFDRLPVAIVVVSPAGAGMDLLAESSARSPSCFPRRRGDGPFQRRGRREARAFPPQARGWTFLSGHDYPREIVSPAGAGMDLKSQEEPPWPPGFPRRRGDGPLSAGGEATAGLFPPQARGWTLVAACQSSRGMVSPAGAGIDLKEATARQDAERFPRRRGDGP